MKDNRRRAINEFERLAQYIAGVQARVDAVRVPLTAWEFHQGRHCAPGQYQADAPWQPYTLGDIWGGEDVTAWFRTGIEIPEALHGRRVVLRVYPGGEAILRVNGVPCFGIDYNHREYLLTECAHAGDHFEVELECYYRDAPDDAIRNDIRITHAMSLAELAAKDEEIERLYYDLYVLHDVALSTEESRPDLSARLMHIARHAVAMIDPYETDAAAYRASAQAASAYLHSALFDTQHDRPAGTLHLVGHCHIDLIYVWPYRESVRKNLRTNLTALSLMARYPEYLFSQSQAKLYADMQRYYPEAFAEVKRRVAAGRFEPVGGMWVEPDGNIPGGEALVRQILYGQAYFQREFQQRSTICWMPDVFGVTAALPQILAQSGFSVFYTNKQSVWHDTNEFPYTTFWWEGIDGTRIMSHIPPTHFVGKMDAQSLQQQWSAHKNPAQAPDVLYTFGYGDGGGGPTEQMLEYARRLKRMDGMPQLQCSTAEAFAAALRASADELPVWADELYLEMHRGAQTSKSNIKQLNRRAEAQMRNTEALHTVAALLCPSLPSRSLEAEWKQLLECHFHDGVTGTHCTEAGVEMVKNYTTLLQTLQEQRAHAMQAIAPVADAATHTLYNLTGTVSAGHVIWQAEGDVTLRDETHCYPTQRLQDGSLLSYVSDLPAFGHTQLSVVPRTDVTEHAFTLREDRLESAHFHLRFDAQGRLCSLFDRDAARQVLDAPGNAFTLYEDKPGRFEAWDIANDYQQRPIDAIRFLGCRDGQCGPLMASKILRWQVGNSQMTQEIMLYAHARRIDFRTTVDWREERKLLRVAFPLALHSKEAVYEIAYGTLTRPTRPTSPFDIAKFEASFHRWFDVSEYGYGVSLLNDGKYGGVVRENVASISLLKSPRFPDPTSDLGTQTFTYSLYPHAGSWQSGETFQQAVLMNNPLLLVPGTPAQARMEYLHVSRPGISIEALKPAEDGDGIIIRTVDYFGQRGPVHLTLPFPITKATACDLLEAPTHEEFTVSGNTISYTGRPYGIRTFRVHVAKGSGGEG